MTRTLVRTGGTLVLVVALLLGTASSKALAWGHGWGWGYPGYYGYYGYYYPYYYSPYYGYPYAYSWAYPSYYWPYYSSYSYPYFSYSYPAYCTGVSSTMPSAASSYAPSTSESYFDVVPNNKLKLISAGNPSANGDDKRAHLVVRLPDSNAELIVDGKKIDSDGLVRYSHSPELAPGTYAYDVKACWKVNGETITKDYTVKVKPGTRSLVDFTSPANQ